MRFLVPMVVGGGVALAATAVAVQPVPKPAAPPLAVGTVADNTLAAGRKVAGMCRTCHGLDGYAKIPIAPHIGGEPAGYISAQLKAFRDGTRQHEMMSVVARTLTDDQIDAVAAWYASHTAEANLPAGVDATAAPEACVACHGADGIGVAEDVPNLAGETNIYIETQLKAFRTDKRSHDVMSDIAKSLDAAELRPLADWYANIDLTIKTNE